MAFKKKVLGKGLSALIEKEAPSIATSGSGSGLTKVSIKDIVPNRFSQGRLLMKMLLRS